VFDLEAAIESVALSVWGGSRRAQTTMRVAAEFKGLMLSLCDHREVVDVMIWSQVERIEVGGAEG